MALGTPPLAILELSSGRPIIFAGPQAGRRSHVSLCPSDRNRGLQPQDIPIPASVSRKTGRPPAGRGSAYPRRGRVLARRHSLRESRRRIADRGNTVRRWPMDHLGQGRISAATGMPRCVVIARILAARTLKKISWHENCVDCGAGLKASQHTAILYLIFNSLQ